MKYACFNPDCGAVKAKIKESSKAPPPDGWTPATLGKASLGVEFVPYASPSWPSICPLPARAVYRRYVIFNEGGGGGLTVALADSILKPDEPLMAICKRLKCDWKHLEEEDMSRYSELLTKY
jgi:hypothetical protein